jgi:hypothetical protein
VTEGATEALPIELPVVKAGLFNFSSSGADLPVLYVGDAPAFVAARAQMRRQGGRLQSTWESRDGAPALLVAFSTGQSFALLLDPARHVGIARKMLAWGVAMVTTRDPALGSQAATEQGIRFPVDTTSFTVDEVFPDSGWGST